MKQLWFGLAAVRMGIQLGEIHQKKNVVLPHGILPKAPGNMEASNPFSKKNIMPRRSWNSPVLETGCQNDINCTKKR